MLTSLREVFEPSNPEAWCPGCFLPAGRGGRAGGEAGEVVPPALVESSPSEMVARKSGGNVSEWRGTRGGDIPWVLLLASFSLLCRCRDIPTRPLPLGLSFLQSQTVTLD